jgi:hypothetical protein
MTSRCRRFGGSRRSNDLPSWTFCILHFAFLSISSPALAQTVSQRGFIEGRFVEFPEHAQNDPTRSIGDVLVRDEVFVKLSSWFRVASGLELRANSHDQVDDRWRVDVSDRGTRRPRASLHRLAATFSTGKLTVDAGKQFIRWGKADIVTPTDRFAPRDYLNVIDSEFLPVTGVRGTLQVSSHDAVEGVWVPWLTPSRTPLFDQRWTVIPETARDIRFVDLGAEIPNGSQLGLRWNHVGERIEYSASIFDGFNHLPNLRASVRGAQGGGACGPCEDSESSSAAARASGGGAPRALSTVGLTRLYPPMRMYGGDAALPTHWLTIKGEAAYFTSTSASTDEYVLYVVQLERQTGEWVFVGGYAGEAVTHRRAALTFAPDRGMTRSVVGRASYTIDGNRSIAFDTAVRQSGRGAYARVEYSEAAGQHWRTTMAAAVITGHSDDFLGQFHRNSYATLALRYSF